MRYKYRTKEKWMGNIQEIETEEDFGNSFEENHGLVYYKLKETEGK